MCTRLGLSEPVSRKTCAKILTTTNISQERKAQHIFVESRKSQQFFKKLSNYVSQSKKELTYDHVDVFRQVRLINVPCNIVVQQNNTARGVGACRAFELQAASRNATEAEVHDHILSESENMPYS